MLETQDIKDKINSRIQHLYPDEPAVLRGTQTTALLEVLVDEINEEIRMIFCAMRIRDGGKCA